MVLLSPQRVRRVGNAEPGRPVRFVMRVFLTGASGFVGSGILHALLKRNVEVFCGARNPQSRSRMPGVTWVDFDFNALPPEERIQEMLGAVDAVINAVGIIRETRRLTFQQVHADAPLTLFRAAKNAGVARLVQISAAGVRPDSEFEYFTSKHQVDTFLLEEAPERSLILRPSLIFGAGGEATDLFFNLAKLPVIPLPAGGQFSFRPIARDDLAQLVVEGLFAENMPTGAIEVGGSDELTLRELLLVIRGKKGQNGTFSGPTLGIPKALMMPAAWFGDVTRAGPLDSDMLGMLVSSESFSVDQMKQRFRFVPRGIVEVVEELRDAR